MTIELQRLRSRLQGLIDGTIGASELTDFVHLSRSLCQAHLNRLRPSADLLCQHHGITITDLSYDCVAEAFARDEEGCFHLLANFVDSLRGSLDDLPDLEIFLAYKSFLWRIASAQLARLYAQADPAGAKIHRNIRDCVRNSGLFTLERDSRDIVLSPIQTDTLDHRERFPDDELRQAFMASAQKGAKIPDLLGALHDILTGETRYRRTVLLSDFVQMVKEVYGTAEIPLSDEHTLQFDELTRSEIDQVRLQVEGVIREKIILTYLARGKIERPDAEAMYGALQDIFSDWCEGGNSSLPIYQYLRRHKDISEEEFTRDLRVKMDYMLKIAREEFSARLLREL